MRFLGSVLAAILLSQLWFFEASAQSASQDALDELRTDAVSCDLNGDGTVLRYVGPTDDGAHLCFNDHDGRPNLTLLVTSGGGDVEKAIAASEIIDRNNWSISILGMCASSCANYWVPSASSVEVLPWSFIILHGSPDSFSARFFAGDIVAHHRAFAERHDVETAWFGNLGFGSAVARFFGANIPSSLLSGPCHLERNLENISVRQYWWPDNQQTYEQFISLVLINAGDIRVKKCDKLFN